MQPRPGQRTAIAWQSDEISWWGLLASIGINGAAWAALLLIYQHASDDLDVIAAPRTPIVWLKPVNHNSQQDKRANALLQKAKTSSEKRRSINQHAKIKTPVSSVVDVQTELSLLQSMPSQAKADDVWSSNQQRPGVVASRGSTGTDTAGMFRPDPLQLRRSSHLPAQIARLKLRMRSVGGPAARAQLKVCGALLSQWEGLRLNAANDQAPLGLQPAGRQAVWRTLQQEGCLD